jgi:hypothetical protein
MISRVSNKIEENRALLKRNWIFTHSPGIEYDALEAVNLDAEPDSWVSIPNQSVPS